MFRYRQTQISFCIVDLKLKFNHNYILRNKSFLVKKSYNILNFVCIPIGILEIDFRTTFTRGKGDALCTFMFKARH